VEDFDVWGGMGAGAGQDTGAIFVPVDTGHHAEFGTTSPNGGLQQWVSNYDFDIFMVETMLTLTRKIGIFPLSSRNTSNDRGCTMVFAKGPAVFEQPSYI
jgi:hypothetical protein